MFYLYVYMCICHMFTWYPWRSEEGLGFPSLELQLQIIVSCHVSIGIWTQVLWKCSSLLSHSFNLYNPLKKKILYFKVCLCDCMCGCPQRLEDGFRSRGAGAIGVSELSDVCTGIKIQVLVTEWEMFLTD